MATPTIKLTAIDKVYPGVKSLDQVDFVVMPGEIHALLGENGAGKSTLTRVIGGATAPNSGTIEFEGKTVIWHSPRHAHEAGIHVIHQELALFPELSVAENILIDEQPRGMLGLISRSERVRRAEEVLEGLGVKIPARTLVADLTLADQQMVEIAKALVGEAKLIVLDEPTAVISGREVDALFEKMRRLKASGIALVYISHRLEEIFEIADRVTVLKDGRVVGTADVADIDRNALVRMMVGRQLADIFPSRPAPDPSKPVVLEVENLVSGRRVQDVSFDVREGEIVCLAGMVGSGRTEVAEAVFGRRPIDSGAIRLKGEAFRAATPRSAIGAGIGFLTENRQEEGLFRQLSIASNIVAPSLGDITDRGLLQNQAEKTIADEQIRAFSIATPSADVKVGALSGGNQQKVLFGRWSRIANTLLILDEPTRGIDVGAKVEIYRLIRALADKGTAILMISSELPEVIGLADRIVVMAQGRVSGELAGEEMTEEKVMALAVVSHDRVTAGDAAAREAGAS